MKFEEKLKKYRLNTHEYGLIEKLLGRAPQGIEWALFSALWSEHCSYKSSKVHLKKLYRSSPRVLEAEGENAGVVDLGQGERVAFKMESHNHPSFIEPYQGAATGVGGILRDIFTMGARPICLANYLCFGEPSAPRMKALVDGVVRGIGGYGNCVGVPNITGQTEFHESYNGNILVNAFALGYFAPGEDVHLSKAKGVGNRVVYVGARTGRDGVHGASMASESFDESSESKRPTVQIGDPFFEKLLIESCLEVMKEGLVVAIQDMGAAGLTSSSFEMASKGNVGLSIDLSRVPLRDSSCGPEEILLSESQERMLLIAEPAKVKRIQEIFARWGLESVDIGEVIAERQVRLFWRGEKICEIDPHLLVENAPVYQREFSEWKFPRRTSTEFGFDAGSGAAEQSLTGDMSERNVPSKNMSGNMAFGTHLNVGAAVASRDAGGLMATAAACSREWIYNQYDQRVMTNTVRGCEQPFGVVRLPRSGRALAVALGCRPHVMRMDAWIGGVDTVAFPVLKMALCGFEPVAVTDCLNFASPEKSSIMSEFVASLDGMNKACELFQAPIISGNVSFYNETLDKPITSTPSTGIVGLRDRVDGLPSAQFTKAGETIYRLRLPLVASVGRIAELNKTKNSFAGEINLADLKNFAQVLHNVSAQISAGRMVGEFGLVYALERMCLDGVGANITSQIDNPFAEVFYEAIVTSADPKFAQLLDGLKTKYSLSKLEVVGLGTTGGDSLKLGTEFNVSIQQLHDAYKGGWEKSGLPV